MKLKELPGDCTQAVTILDTYYTLPQAQSGHLPQALGSSMLPD